jgi:regulator of protease activity HflC (stomatin/prohibitin superfamily)
MLNLDRETQGWGVKIVRVEIQEIKLSEELMKARDAELAAESRRKAKESEAKAAVESIRIISDALRDSSNPKVTLQYLLAKGYIEAQQDISKSENTKIIFMDPKALTEATSEFIVAEELESGEGGMGNGR